MTASISPGTMQRHMLLKMVGSGYLRMHDACVQECCCNATFAATASKKCVPLRRDTFAEEILQKILAHFVRNVGEPAQNWTQELLRCGLAFL